MKKRLVAIVLCMVLLVAFPATAWASTSAPTATEMARLECLVMTANVSISAMVVVAQITPYNDVPWLLWMVDRVAGSVMDYASSIGATVECQYVTYQIDGQSVEIDPLRVVNVGTGH